MRFECKKLVWYWLPERQTNKLFVKSRACLSGTAPTPIAITCFIHDHFVGNNLLWRLFQYHRGLLLLWIALPLHLSQYSKIYITSVIVLPYSSIHFYHHTVLSLWTRARFPPLMSICNTTSCLRQPPGPVKVVSTVIKINAPPDYVVEIVCNLRLI